MYIVTCKATGSLQFGGPPRLFIASLSYEIKRADEPTLLLVGQSCKKLLQGSVLVCVKALGMKADR